MERGGTWRGAWRGGALGGAGPGARIAHRGGASADQCEPVTCMAQGRNKRFSGLVFNVYVPLCVKLLSLRFGPPSPVIRGGHGGGREAAPQDPLPQPGPLQTSLPQDEPGTLGSQGRLRRVQA